MEITDQAIDPAQVDTGAASEPGATQDAGAVSQETLQGQESTPAQVDGQEAKPSSAGTQGSASQGNLMRAMERRLEKQINKALENQMKPLFERLNSFNPPAPQPTAASETPIDYNNLSGSIQKMVEQHFAQLSKTQLPQQVDQRLTQFQGKLESDSKMQEARKYLKSQKDYSGTEDQKAELAKIIEENLWTDKVETHPQEVAERAMKLWRASRVNPNVPPASHLSGVTGGTAPRAKQPPSLEKLMELQRKIPLTNTIEEKEKLYAEIESLTAA